MVRENNDSLTSYQYFDDSRIETDKLFLFTYQFSNFSGLILILTIINMIQKTTRKSIKIIPFFLELNNLKIYTVAPIFYEFSQILEFFRCCCIFSSNISSTSNITFICMRTWIKITPVDQLIFVRCYFLLRFQLENFLFHKNQSSGQFTTGFIRLKSGHDPIVIWCFYLKSSKWTEPNAMHTCDRNGSPSEIMTAINRAKSHVHGLLFYFAIIWRRRRRSIDYLYIPFPPHCTWL